MTLKGVSDISAEGNYYLLYSEHTVVHLVKLITYTYNIIHGDMH